jgi:23S rRNA G2445 N2-methylase RlmL
MPKIPIQIDKGLTFSGSMVAEIPNGVEDIAATALRGLGAKIIGQDTGKLLFSSAETLKQIYSYRFLDKVYLVIDALGKDNRWIVDNDALETIADIYSSSGVNKPAFGLRKSPKTPTAHRSTLIKDMAAEVEKRFPFEPRNSNFLLRIASVGGRVVALVELKYCEDEHMRFPYRSNLLPFSLNPVLANLIVRAVGAKDDEVFMDPMCGAGTILIERAMIGPYKRLLGGDITRKAVSKARDNLSTMGVRATVKRWDATHLPLANESITTVVSNLPYGIRASSHEENLKLYPRFMKDISRVLSVGGRGGLLTQEKRLLEGALARSGSSRLTKIFKIETGGLRPTLYVFRRVS